MYSADIVLSKSTPSVPTHHSIFKQLFTKNEQSLPLNKADDTLYDYDKRRMFDSKRTKSSFDSLNIAPCEFHSEISPFDKHQFRLSKILPLENGTELVAKACYKVICETQPIAMLFRKRRKIMLTILILVKGKICISAFPITYWHRYRQNKLLLKWETHLCIPKKSLDEGFSSVTTILLPGKKMLKPFQDKGNLFDFLANRKTILLRNDHRNSNLKAFIPGFPWYQFKNINLPLGLLQILSFENTDFPKPVLSQHRQMKTSLKDASFSRILKLQTIRRQEQQTADNIIVSRKARSAIREGDFLEMDIFPHFPDDPLDEDDVDDNMLDKVFDGLKKMERNREANRELAMTLANTPIVNFTKEEKDVISDIKESKRRHHLPSGQDRINKRKHLQALQKETRFEEEYGLDKYVLGGDFDRFIGKNPFPKSKRKNKARRSRRMANRGQDSLLQSMTPDVALTDRNVHRVRYKGDMRFNGQIRTGDEYKNGLIKKTRLDEIREETYPEPPGGAKEEYMLRDAMEDMEQLEKEKRRNLLIARQLYGGYNAKRKLDLSLSVQNRQRYKRHHNLLNQEYRHYSNSDGDDETNHKTNRDKRSATSRDKDRQLEVVGSEGRSFPIVDGASVEGDEDDEDDMLRKAFDDIARLEQIREKKRNMAAMLLLGQSDKNDNDDKTMSLTNYNAKGSNGKHHQRHYHHHRHNHLHQQEKSHEKQQQQPRQKHHHYKEQQQQHEQRQQHEQQQQQQPPRQQPIRNVYTYSPFVNFDGDVDKTNSLKAYIDGPNNEFPESTRGWELDTSSKYKISPVETRTQQRTRGHSNMNEDTNNDRTYNSKGRVWDDPDKDSNFEEELSSLSKKNGKQHKEVKVYKPVHPSANTPILNKHDKTVDYVDEGTTDDRFHQASTKMNPFDINEGDVQLQQGFQQIMDKVEKLEKEKLSPFQKSPPSPPPRNSTTTLGMKVTSNKNTFSRESKKNAKTSKKFKKLKRTKITKTNGNGTKRKIQYDLKALNHDKTHHKQIHGKARKRLTHTTPMTSDFDSRLGEDMESGEMEEEEREKNESMMVDVVDESKDRIDLNVTKKESWKVFLHGKI